MQRNILKIYNYFLKQNRILTSCSFGEASRNSFLFPFILYQFDKDNIYKTGPLAEFTFNMVILSLLALFCLINILGYFIANYLINKYSKDIENRYPILSKWIYLFNKTNKLYLIIEIILLFLSIITFLFCNLLFLYLLYNN